MRNQTAFWCYFRSFVRCVAVSAALLIPSISYGLEGCEEFEYSEAARHEVLKKIPQVREVFDLLDFEVELRCNHPREFAQDLNLSIFATRPSKVALSDFEAWLISERYWIFNLEPDQTCTSEYINKHLTCLRKISHADQIFAGGKSLARLTSHRKDTDPDGHVITVTARGVGLGVMFQRGAEL